MLRRRMKSERGAAIVEFALVIPILLMLVVGIFEFGRMYYIQTTLSMAARQGARILALNPGAGGVAAARSATKSAALDLGLADGEIAISPSGGCPTTGTTEITSTVTISHPTAFITGMFGTTIDLHGKGVMRCNG
jgi:Flp pilus assembly protein TadG